MPLAIIVMVVLTLLGTALWQYSMTDLKHVSREEKKLQAYYLARSGAELVANNLENLKIDIGGVWPGEAEPLISLSQEFQNIEKAFFRIELYEDNEEQKIIIISTGEVDNITETLILEVSSHDYDVRYWRQ